MSEANPVQVKLEALLQLRHAPIPTIRSSVLSNGQILGSFISRTRGTGTEYNDLRAYSSGDDIRHIDWHASARMSSLQTRLYTQEKDHHLTIICDLRNSMFTGSTDLRANRAVWLCARLLWCATRGGTRVNLFVLTEDGTSTIEPGAGSTAALRACVLLSTEHQRRSMALMQHRQKLTGISADKQVNKADDEQIQTGSAQSETYTAARQIRRIETSQDNPAHAQTLQSRVRHTQSTRQHNTTRLWVSGLDFEGEGFVESLSTMVKRTQDIVVHINDPMLNTPLPVGIYNYHSHKIDSSAQRSALINRYNRSKLIMRLAEIHSERIERYKTAQVPLLSTTEGDEALIALLKHSGVIG